MKTRSEEIINLFLSPASSPAPPPEALLPAIVLEGYTFNKGHREGYIGTGSDGDSLIKAAGIFFSLINTGL